MTDWHEPYNKALDYLSRREYGAIELKKKLIKFGFEESIVSVAMEQVQKNNLQCDHRFAEAYIRSRSKRGMGPQKIELELNQKWIDEGLFYETVRQLSSEGELDWFQIIQDEYEKKYRNTEPSNYNEWTKRARFLQGRGFTFEQINTVLSSQKF